MAFLLAAAGLGIGTLVREVFALAGANLIFATYYPVILFGSLVLGTPAGITMTIVVPIIAWWAFIPPRYGFSPLNVTDYANFAMFAISASMIVWLSSLYRTSMAMLLQERQARELLINELNHRSGNLLTVIQSIVRGSLPTSKEEGQVLTKRIEALAAAETLSTTTLQGTVPIVALLTRELSAFPAHQVSFEGPELLLETRAARYLGLVLHELRTNAAKYGALSRDSGRIAIQWSTTDDLCRLSWVESGGPPLEAPSRSGFGSRMIRASLETISGTLETEFRQEGLRCEISFRNRKPNDLKG